MATRKITNTIMQTEKVTIEFDDKTVRLFVIATVVWSIVAMLVGVLVASQLNFWEMNGKFIEWITFGAFKTEGIPKRTSFSAIVHF